MKKVFLITLLLVSYLSYGQVNLDDGLVLYYPFNGNANDESGNNHDGVVSGASLTSDKFSNSSKAYLFDGINDNITIWNSSETNANVNTDSGAISVWINPKNAGFVYQYYASNNDRFYLHLLPSLPGYRIGFGNEYIEVIEEIDFNSTIWYNFTINYYSNGNVKVYFDGGLSATYTYTNPGFIFGGGENFYLGQGWSQNRSNYEEKIDEFRLYNRPLNTDEIESLFNLTDGGGTPSITTLIVDGAAASATLSAGESHWYQFEVTTSGEHYIETHGSTDMYMVLYQNDGTTQITYDDDSGENTNSKITRDLTVGWYKVEMSGYSSSVTGDYTIDVKSGGPIDVPDILSVDYGPPTTADTWQKFTIPITATAFGLASDVFNASMKNISLIRIMTETHSGDDKGAIDQVALGNGFLSAFNNGTENWSAMGDGTLSWESSGGISGGYITIEDWATGDTHWAAAPGSWTGDLSAYIGQSFSFYYKTDHPSGIASVEFHTGESNRIILAANKQTLTAGETTQMAVSLSTTPGESVTVNLSSSSSGKLSVPSSVTIPAGSSSATVDISATQDLNEGDEVVITASATGYETTRITITGSEAAPLVTLIVDGAAANATLGAGESHWYQFEVTASGEYYIETHGSIDMYMVFYQSDGTTQITYDDDSGENTNSKITRDLTAGWYKVEMSGYSSSVTGDYTIDVKSGGPIDVPDILTVDYGPPTTADTWQKFTIPITAATFGLEEAVFNASMKNISLIRIATEMSTGVDKCGLDQIALGNGFLSSFDSGTENWSAMGDGTMSWEASGGIPGGHLTIQDWSTGILHWAAAPVSWTGDLSAYIGQDFTFYYKTNQPNYNAKVEFHTGTSSRIILSANKQTLSAGETTQMTVSLSPAPSESVTVNLNSSNSGKVTVPSSVTIPGGSGSATVTVSATQDINEGDIVVITASATGYETTRITITGGEAAASVVTLVVDGAAASATLGAGESHWYQFEVTTSGEHYIETHGSTDMYMVLYQNDGTTQITYDDDSGENTNSKVTRDLTVGWYKVEMSGYSSSITGDYTIDVKSQSNLLPPTNLAAAIDPADANDILLSWDAPSSGTPTGYNVYHSSSENGTYTSLGTVPSVGARVYDNYDGVHWFYVTAQYAGGESDPTNKAAATVGEPIDVPEILSVEYGPPVTADTWEQFTIPLIAEIFGLTSDVFQASMQNISLIRIRTEMHSGSDKCGVDNIALGDGYLSTFGSGTENWSAMGDGTMSWEASGGIPGGFITIEDWTSGDWHWAAAPASWSGNLSAYIGQNFTFHYKTNQPSYSAVVEFHTGTSNRIILLADKQVLLAGETTKLTVSLSSAPSENVTVALSSSNTGLVTVPASITILAGQSSASVTIQASQNISQGDNVVITASATGYETTRITISGGNVTAIDVYKNLNDITLYPNPTNGKFKIKFNNSIEGTVQIEIHNMLGQLVHSSVNNSSDEIEINIGSYSKGIYNVKVTDGRKLYTKKILLE